MRNVRTKHGPRRPDAYLHNLLGRAGSVRSTISLLTAPFGPLVAGALLASVSAWGGRGRVRGLRLTLALWGTLSPSLRNAPNLDELRLAYA